MDQLVLIKSAHKIERTPGSWLQGGVHCQEAQIDSITLHIHQITPKIARSSLRRVGAEIVIPVQSQINIMIPLLRALLVQQGSNAVLLCISNKIWGHTITTINERRNSKKRILKELFKNSKRKRVVE